MSGVSSEKLNNKRREVQRMDILDDNKFLLYAFGLMAAVLFMDVMAL